MFTITVKSNEKPVIYTSKRPIIPYRSEIWPLRKIDKNKLLVFENKKILRTNTGLWCPESKDNERTESYR